MIGQICTIWPRVFDCVPMGVKSIWSNIFSIPIFPHFTEITTKAHLYQILRRYSGYCAIKVQFARFVTSNEPDRITCHLFPFTFCQPNGRGNHRAIRRFFAQLAELIFSEMFGET